MQIKNFRTLYWCETIVDPFLLAFGGISGFKLLPQIATLSSCTKIHHNWHYRRLWHGTQCIRTMELNDIFCIALSSIVQSWLVVAYFSNEIGMGNGTSKAFVQICNISFQKLLLTVTILGSSEGISTHHFSPQFQYLETIIPGNETGDSA